jgi:hypothetical protein
VRARSAAPRACSHAPRRQPEVCSSVLLGWQLATSSSAIRWQACLPEHAAAGSLTASLVRGQAPTQVSSPLQASGGNALRPGVARLLWHACDWRGCARAHLRRVPHVSTAARLHRLCLAPAPPARRRRAPASPRRLAPSVRRAAARLPRARAAVCRCPALHEEPDCVHGHGHPNDTLPVTPDRAAGMLCHLAPVWDGRGLSLARVDGKSMCDNLSLTPTASQACGTTWRCSATTASWAWRTRRSPARPRWPGLLARRSRPACCCWTARAACAAGSGSSWCAFW